MIGKDVLDIENFDPLSVDLTEIKNATNQIPQDGFIEPSDAGRLATIFLVAADRCSDLVAMAHRWKGYLEVETRTEKARAIARKMNPSGGTKGLAGTVAKEAYGDDEDYICICKKNATASAWLDYVTRQYELLNKYHHLCKGMVSSNDMGRNTSGWDEQGIYKYTENELEHKQDGKKVVGRVSWD